MSKYYFVPWEGYALGSQPEMRSDLDRLCLQGPHDLETAHRIAQEIRSAGCLASVIDCTESLKPIFEQEIIQEQLVAALKASLPYTIGTPESEQAKRAIAKAEGRILTHD